MLRHAAILKVMNNVDAIKVLIVNEHGQYLAGTAIHWEFTEDRLRARVFDYHKDQVTEQLQLVHKVYGTIWIAVQLDPKETYEFCDRCGTRMTTPHTVFDGAHFLCRECQADADAPVNDKVADKHSAIQPVVSKGANRRYKGNAGWKLAVPPVGPPA